MARRPIRLEPVRHTAGKAQPAGLLAGHGQVRAACDLLECLCDALPTRPATALRVAAADRIEEALLSHLKATHRFLERFRGDRRRPVCDALARILKQQIANALDAREVSVALRSGSADVPVGILARMLRRLIRSCREAIAFETRFLLALRQDRAT